MYSNSLANIYDAHQMFPVKDVLKQLSKSLENIKQIQVEIECQNKPKLRTFITFKDLTIYLLMFIKHSSSLKEKLLARHV